MQPGPFPFPYSVFLGAALFMVLLMGTVLIFCPFGLQKENNPRTPGWGMLLNPLGIWEETVCAS